MPKVRKHYLVDTSQSQKIQHQPLSEDFIREMQGVNTQAKNTAQEAAIESLAKDIARGFLVRLKSDQDSITVGVEPHRRILKLTQQGENAFVVLPVGESFETKQQLVKDIIDSLQANKLVTDEQLKSLYAAQGLLVSGQKGVCDFLSINKNQGFMPQDTSVSSKVFDFSTPPPSLHTTETFYHYLSDDAQWLYYKETGVRGVKRVPCNENDEFRNAIGQEIKQWQKQNVDNKKVPETLAISYCDTNGVEKTVVIEPLMCIKNLVKLTKQNQLVLKTDYEMYQSGILLEKKKYDFSKKVKSLHNTKNNHFRTKAKNILFNPQLKQGFSPESIQSPLLATPVLLTSLSLESCQKYYTTLDDTKRSTQMNADHTRLTVQIKASLVSNLSQEYYIEPNEGGVTFKVATPDNQEDEAFQVLVKMICEDAADAAIAAHAKDKTCIFVFDLSDAPENVRELMRTQFEQKNARSDTTPAPFQVVCTKAKPVLRPSL